MIRSLFNRWGIIAALIICVLAGGVFAALRELEHQRSQETRASELSYLPSGPYLRVAVLGYRRVVADAIWLKAVQYFGEKKQTTHGYRWAYRATDVVTDLDPQFTLAYYSGGTILGVWAGLLEESIALLIKGMQHDPKDWRFPFLIGYDYFYEMCDVMRGAEYLRKASILPGAPPYLAQLAARMSAEAGDSDAAIEFLARFSRQISEPGMREVLDLRMREVVAERDIRFLEKGVEHFKSTVGRLPSSFDELLSRKIIETIPKEPLGGQYELKQDGTVVSTGLRERLRAHRKVACPTKAAFVDSPSAGIGG